jgi:hypothetical protein
VNVADWNHALVDVLLPEDVNAGRPVRLACDDQAIVLAARRFNLRSADPVAELIGCLRVNGLVDNTRGVSALAAAPMATGDPPACLAGLAVLVLAAARMVTDETSTMRAYYARLAEMLGTDLHASWPPVPGVPALTERFTDLAAWMAGPQAGRRGLLDLPDAHRYVDIPIHQTILRTGDRARLGAFFARSGRLIAAGWDPVHQLRRWGGRHQLSAPIQQLLARDELAPALAAALRGAHRSWDGSVLDEHGRRVMPGTLTLHLLGGGIALGIAVGALDGPAAAIGPEDTPINLTPDVAAEVPLDWLAHAATGPVQAQLPDEGRVRVLSGPTMIFELTELGPREVPSAVDEPVWVLTCEHQLIGRIEPGRHYHADLPAGWRLLCDVQPAELPDDLREWPPGVDTLDVALTGGLKLAGDVWLLDHPPTLVCDLGEPAPVSVDGSDRGYADPGTPFDLGEIAHTPGVHTVCVANRELTVELAEHGTREGLGGLAIDIDQRRVHHGPRPGVPPDAPRICGAVVFPDDSRVPWQPPLIVRYRAQVDVIDADGTVRTLSPPAAPAPWLSHVGLTPGDAWEIPTPSDAVWICVDAAAGRFVVCRRTDDVPVTDAVLDVVDLHHDSTIVDRADGAARGRWARLVAALDAGETAHAQ